MDQRLRAAVQASLIEINDSGLVLRCNARAMWQSIATAPFDCDLELAVLDDEGPHALVFPCRRVPLGWIKAQSEQRIEVRPTHWRPWTKPS